MQTSTLPHVWSRPEDIAAQLHATKHGASWRARCPVHDGENPSSLAIALGQDRHGHPCTLLKCYAHDCDIRDLCAALGIELRSLFALHPDYSHATRRAPRATGPGIHHVRQLDDPSPDDLAECMLIEMLTTDPGFLETCPPARATCLRLRANPARLGRLSAAFKRLGYQPSRLWARLVAEQEGDEHAD
jgi:hypothetical protein